MTNDFLFDLKEIPNVDVASKTTLFILDHSENKPNIIETLHKIASALHINVIEDLQILWLTEYHNLNVGPIVNKCQQVVFFGLDPSQLGMNIQAISPYHFYQLENASFILSDNMQSIIDDKNKKLQLWTSLQKQFGLIKA